MSDSPALKELGRLLGHHSNFYGRIIEALREQDKKIERLESEVQELLKHAHYHVPEDN